MQTKKQVEQAITSLMGDNQTCRRCGTCCRKGGPALHAADLELIRGGMIRPDHLITIRKGEAVLFPFEEQPRPSEAEFVKVAGARGEWTCCFFSEPAASCLIYEHRPLECRLLQCWDTAELEAVVGRDLLTRQDILGPADSLRELIALHESSCPCTELPELIAGLASEAQRPSALAALTELARRDLACRAQVLARLTLPAGLELFLFGRPIFAMLSACGLVARERDGELYLEYVSA